MRFSRSRYRPYGAAAFPPSGPRIPSRRLWRISRPRATLFAIAAAVALGLATDRAWIKGNGIVAGELTAVAPIVQARLQRVFVQCLDHVVRGEQLLSREDRFDRVVVHDDQSFRARIETRGYLYELTPPVPVEVLRWRIISQRKVPPALTAAAHP